MTDFDSRTITNDVFGDVFHFSMFFVAQKTLDFHDFSYLLNSCEIHCGVGMNKDFTLFLCFIISIIPITTSGSKVARPNIQPIASAHGGNS